MDISLFESLISNLGFPAAVCGALFWYNRETVKHYERLLLEFSEVIKENTRATSELCNKIRGEL